jgi:hypothetical protein
VGSSPMNTIATKQQPSPAVEAARSGHRNFNLRAYFAGGAVTAALIAAGVVVFGSLAAYVAFNGLPVGGGDTATDSVAVEASAGAPQNAAATLGAAAGAVAATPAATTAIAPAPGVAAANGGATTAPGTTAPATGTPTGTTPTATTPSGTAPATTADTGSESSSSGPVANTVRGLEGVAAGAGVDVPLSDMTDGITGPVDETVQGTLDQVGQLTDPILGN